MGKTPNKVRTRLVFGFFLVCVFFAVLCFRVGWIQIVKADEYSKMAKAQQTRDVTIEASRGDVLDRNGEELATSAVCYSIWVRPRSVKDADTLEAQQLRVQKYVNELSEALEMEPEEVQELITRDQTLVKIAKYQNKSVADAVKALKLPGVEITEEVKRHYPLGDFASQLLGSVTDENQGLSGIELKYNQYLSGVSGRWIKNADKNGQSLAYGLDTYYSPEDGLNVVLTIDEVIQHYVEQAIDDVMVETGSDRVLCLMMDPKTGDVLAMATTPGFDPNDPRTPLDEADREAYPEWTSDEQLDYLNRMWRNPIVSDVYEPGSTSKLITTAIALEEGLTNINEGFYDPGSIQVADATLKCWRYYAPHGQESLIQAVGNSCNPVFVQLAQRIGMTRFYQYLELFGMTERTGIDYPGESYPIIQTKQNAGPVGLATMSYGQGIAVNMVQQLAAICAFGNDGVLMQPRLVKELTDKNGKVVKTFDTVKVRQVVSPATAEQMCRIMEYVVSDGGAGTAKIPGYRIGGKTGTAQKPSEKGGYTNNTYSSFIGMAPMDDPQIAILLVVDNPRGVKYGSTTAAPGAKVILENTLRYMGIEPQYTQQELVALGREQVRVPNYIGMGLSGAISQAASAGFGYKVSGTPDADDNNEVPVTDQFPKPGEKINSGGTITFYFD